MRKAVFFIQKIKKTKENRLVFYFYVQGGNKVSELKLNNKSEILNI